MFVFYRTVVETQRNLDLFQKTSVFRSSRQPDLKPVVLEIPGFQYTLIIRQVDRQATVTVSQYVILISNGNRTEWSPIRSVIIRVITKSDDRAAGVRFVYHEYDYRLNWTTRSPIIN